MKKKLMGAVTIYPMISPELCLRLNNWLHSRHYQYEFDPELSQTDHDATSLFGYYGYHGMWGMKDIRQTIKNLSETYEPTSAPHLIGLMEKDQAIEQDYLKRVFQIGIGDRITKAIDRFNKPALITGDALTSCLSIVSDYKNNASYIAWDQVSELDGLEFWLRILNQILSELHFRLLSGVLETDTGVRYRVKSNGRISPSSEKLQATNEEEMMEARKRCEEEAIQKVHGMDKLPELFIPRHIDDNWAYYTNDGDNPDPMQFLGRDQLINDFKVWADDEMKLIPIADADRRYPYEDFSRSIDLEENKAESWTPLAKYLSLHGYSEKTLNKAHDIIIPF